MSGDAGLSYVISIKTTSEASLTCWQVASAFAPWSQAWRTKSRNDKQVREKLLYGEFASFVQ